MSRPLPRRALLASALIGAGLAGATVGSTALAQTSVSAANGTWEICTGMAGDKEARLACFDLWAKQQKAAASPVAASPAPAGTVPAVSAAALADAKPVEPPPVNANLPATRVIEVAEEQGCRDSQYSDLSRFWELESGSDCGTFGIRGYRPISLSFVTSDTVNDQPSSPAAGHTAATAIDYRKQEARIQLSVRTKVAQGLLTRGHPTLSDSIWFGYTQQSYWQLFSPALSRPFRATDHEPEVIYVYPTDAQLPGGWRLRYSGLGLVHQSNGQNLPLSRSWNRYYVMAGMEKDNKFRFQARLWQRIKESDGNDDNPDMVDYIGRGEFMGAWNYDKDNTFIATLRSTLRSPNRGSLRLEWLQALGNADSKRSQLRFHTQLFTGYGDSLIDYNRKRTVLSFGLSLVDF
ncbi:phospholipase [Rhodoferax koreense]|uniref:Phospholipase A1 n=1 Tax=Rhodoferax koreensis TaxID=1842727 RepID=A0A1P8K238_9BURK|nr:phospholipase A [Rhodoferax koreense]APW40011.1 phospholipase [Rhodoferax koreense]